MVASMEQDNYIELYEAVYFLQRIHTSLQGHLPARLNTQQLADLRITQSVYQAVIRILSANQFLFYTGENYEINPDLKQKYSRILQNIIPRDNHYAAMYEKATDPSHFFFSRLSSQEYEVYARYNFHLTQNTGKAAVRQYGFSGKKVLEIGGSSGGFASSVLAGSENCRYTIVDTPVSCAVGEELSQAAQTSITFLAGNVFSLHLHLPKEPYSLIVLANFLHDFDDSACLEILRNCLLFCTNTTEFLLVEDVLLGEFEPVQTVMQGLRLAVECRGGKQRTIEEISGLFVSATGRKLKQATRLDTVQTMLVFG